MTRPVVPGDDLSWYLDVVVYELHVKSFADSNGDGIGDFPGLTSRLDHLEYLGVTAVWLLPFYPSPLRDDGYDIADYYGVNPIYGTLEDFHAFLDEAHRRGLRVITELVVNHTSDRHPWFERARSAPPGSPERDFYVWTDDPTLHSEARIIFTDTEESNWTWDPVAGAYYWHRFFSHQPDLNYENPAVGEAVLDVLDHWLGMGVDGLRLDAVPYLHEEAGTDCENLPQTHEELKRIRTHVDEKFPGRLLLAEANQWPEDAAAYFGDGDEVHMNYHFPLMPRLYMALAKADRTPIVEILDRTPEIPDGCQWGIFLRNHDELTLEMVTDEERAYMLSVYARDPRAPLNVGIRRRLAPLLAHEERKTKLLMALLLSMPGTPFLYYGDEIGMGDDLDLPDRDGVRTPMQWDDSDNAGFSLAPAGDLVLPVITGREAGYERVNVADQRGRPGSLLEWVRHALGVRRAHAVFGRGRAEFHAPADEAILAFTVRGAGEVIVVVVNFSGEERSADWTELGIDAPVRDVLTGTVSDPSAGPLALEPYGYRWMAAG